MPLRAILIGLWAVVVPHAAFAAMLFEGTAAGQTLRMVVDRPQERVLIAQGDERALVDLGAGDVYLGLDQDRPRRVQAYFRPGHDQMAPYRLEKFGPGPVIAGHASTYYVLFVEDTVCAEVLASAWMAPFVDPAVQALALLDALKQSESRAAANGSAGTDDACTGIPITTLAAAGWPLLSGKIDRPTFKTDSIRFDYHPSPGELALPAETPPAGTANAAASTPSPSIK